MPNPIIAFPADIRHFAGADWHAAQKAAREWEAGQFVAIRVRPAPHEGDQGTRK